VVTEWSQNFRKLTNQWHQPAPPDDTAKACDLRKWITADTRRHAKTPDFGSSNPTSTANHHLGPRGRKLRPHAIPHRFTPAPHKSSSRGGKNLNL
jgi:hypothetical protein